MASKRVIIIGGGISAIKAALELQKSGIDYLILEAKGRLGGRLRTVQGINTKYDLGASWFHETLNNALFDEENRIRGTVANGANSDGVRAWLYDDAPIKYICETGEVSPFLKLDSISKEIDKFIEMENYKDLEKDQSMHEVLVKYLKERKHLLSDEQIEKAYQAMRRLELWHGIDSKRMSSKYSTIDNEGRDALALNYDSVLKRHVDLLDLSKVFLNTAVKSIKKADGNKTVIVSTEEGQNYHGDYTIVTVPQSILQLDPNAKGRIQFQPSLPKRITDSLSQIHFGALGKVIFEYEEIFWPTDSERVFILASAPEGFLDAIKNDGKAPEYHEDPTNPPKSWEYPLFMLNYGTTLRKPTLAFLTQSPVTEYLESHPDLAYDYFKPIIRKLSNKTDAEIPSPINQLVSEWTIDPYQRGSYSCCYPNDDPLGCILALSEGFGNIRFAGEHTILEGAGCVHGAWNSGKREADYIINDLK